MKFNIGENIQRLRKIKKLTQEELAAKLGVTPQEVCEWEEEKATPDIVFLPRMAEIFGCYIDELFSGEVTADKHYTALPWDDDDTLRGVVFLGKKLLQVSDDLEGDRFTFEVTSETGEIGKVHSEWSIAVSCNVSGVCEAGGDICIIGSTSGSCSAGCNISISGPFSGECSAHGNIAIAGPTSGGCNAGGNVSIKGDVSGDIICGDSMTVDGSVEAGTIRCGDSLKVEGNVEASNIYGCVCCNVLKCEKIKKKLEDD